VPLFDLYSASKDPTTKVFSKLIKTVKSSLSERVGIEFKIIEAFFLMAAGDNKK